MKRRRIIAAVFILISVILSGLHGQGSIMVSGGGGEDWGGWSDAPYRWVVDHAANRKVAVISYNPDQSDWLPNYFKSLGAVEADNIHIGSKHAADQSSMYDLLITYDAIFLKGGDQSRYYEYYRDTKTTEAMQYVFDQGGVLSGTSAGAAILSPIAFTAEVASVDPGQALLNAYSSQVTLAGDFLETYSERYIYDTHFIERGRFGRLPVFMANWYRKVSEVTTGIGIDDHTALCIDQDGTATVYGQGAVTFLVSDEPGVPFDTGANMLISGPMKMHQLLNGCSINLSSFSVTGLENEVVPPVAEENRRNTILFTGTDYPVDTVFEYFIHHAGSPSDAVVIVTGLSTDRAEEMKQSLEDAGAENVKIIQALSGSQGKASVTEALKGARKFLIFENSYYDLMGFVQGWGNGPLLMERLTAPGVVSLFIGDNARFAGKTVVDKYMGFGYTSYHGELEFKKGLGLLETTAIMPYAFIFIEYYENTVSGIPYAMITDSLSYGIYITGNTLAEYGYDHENRSHFRNVAGSFPLIRIRNNGTKTGFADQGPYEVSRNVSGFEIMDLQFLGPGDKVTAGTQVPVNRPVYNSDQKVRVFPNPATTFVRIEGTQEQYVLTLVDLSGRVMFSSTAQNRETIGLNDGSKPQTSTIGSKKIGYQATANGKTGPRLTGTDLPDGMYILKLSDPLTGAILYAAPHLIQKK